jgi:hypothetical protein
MQQEQLGPPIIAARNVFAPTRRMSLPLGKPRLSLGPLAPQNAWGLSPWDMLSLLTATPSR